MNVTYSHNGNDYTVDTDTLGPDAVAYLLTYGFRQSMQDSIAGRAKKVYEEMLTKRAESLAGQGVTVTEAHLNQAAAELATETEMAAVSAAQASDLSGALMKRRDAIQSGSVKAGGQGSRDPFGTLCWNIAADMVVAAFKKKTGKGPKRDTAFETLVDQCLEKHKAAIEKEATRRQKAVTNLPDIEI